MKILKASFHVILDAIEQIEQYTKGYSKEDFFNDKKTMDATLIQLQHIWETTRKIVDNFGDIDFLPTSEMIGLRNFIAHDYLWINSNVIWETVIYDIPEIKEKIEKNMDI